jgi:hypothetical protein
VSAAVDKGDPVFPAKIAEDVANAYAIPPMLSRPMGDSGKFYNSQD